MAPAGMLRMAVAEVDGAPVSAFLWGLPEDQATCLPAALAVTVDTRQMHRVRHPPQAVQVTVSHLSNAIRRSVTLIAVLPV
jgi:hypothetical protein